MSPRRIQFGVFELDPGAGELRKHGIKIKLQEQPLQILQQLLEHPGEVVTREELQKRIWPADTFVDFDHGLYSAVQRLRDALGDTAETPRYVETLPRRGYRFIAPVSSGTAAEVQRSTSNAEPPTIVRQELPSPRTKTRILILVPVGVAVALVAAALVFRGGSLRGRLLGKSDLPPIHSIAVLPLQNFSNDPSQDYFADGMTEELITDLSQISALRVASHQSVLRYKKSDKSLPEIARELNVDALVEGSVQRSGDRIRVTAQLIYAPEDKNIFAKSYERDFRDALALQSALATAIVGEIRVKTTEQEISSLRSVQPLNPKVMEAYLEGTFHVREAWDATWRKQRGKKESDEQYSKALSSFDSVIQTDPRFVPAYLAMAYHIMRMPRLEFAPKAKAALVKVLELDKANLEAHLLMAEYLARFEGNWHAAGNHYAFVVELWPTSARAREAHAEYLDDMGHFEEGMVEHQKAQALDEQFDDMSKSPLTSLAERLKRWRKFLPTDAYHFWWRGNTEYEAGEYAEAFKDWQRAFRDFDWYEEADAFGRAYADGEPQAGAREMARIFDQITKDRWFAADVPIDAHFYAGDKEATLAWLKRAYEGRERVILHLKSDYRWDPYRSDPRFKEIVRRVGLPE